MSDTNEPSPRPWRVSDGFLDRYSTGHRDMVDAKGEFVAVRVSSADAALIVSAVNERDRLRDIVKRMADKLEVHRGIFTASNVWSETGCHETCSLIREARAAIGEGANE